MRLGNRLLAASQVCEVKQGGAEHTEKPREKEGSSFGGGAMADERLIFCKFEAFINL